MFSRDVQAELARKKQNTTRRQYSPDPNSTAGTQRMGDWPASNPETRVKALAGILPSSATHHQHYTQWRGNPKYNGQWKLRLEDTVVAESADPKAWRTGQKAGNNRELLAHPLVDVVHFRRYFALAFFLGSIPVFVPGPTGIKLGVAGGTVRLPLPRSRAKAAVCHFYMTNSSNQIMREIGIPALSGLCWSSCRNRLLPKRWKMGQALPWWAWELCHLRALCSAAWSAAPAGTSFRQSAACSAAVRHSRPLWPLPMQYYGGRIPAQAINCLSPDHDPAYPGRSTAGAYPAGIALANKFCLQHSIMEDWKMAFVHQARSSRLSSHFPRPGKVEYCPPSPQYRESLSHGLFTRRGRSLHGNSCGRSSFPIHGPRQPWAVISIAPQCLALAISAPKPASRSP